MRWSFCLPWLLVVLWIQTAQVAAQTTATAEIEAIRSRLRELDDERARLIEQLGELERRASAGHVETSASAPPPSEAPDLTDDIHYLETVVVTGARREAELGTVPAALTVVPQDVIQNMRRGTNLEESLRRVPGALVRDQLGGSSRVTISVRGAGATATDGARGVRVFVDGIPKNNAGGSAQDFINIDLDATERIEFLRGPSSALYGNQAGGVVSITTQAGGPQPSFSLNQVLGSYGLSRTHLGGGGQTDGGRFNYFGAVYRTTLDGFRVDSKQASTGFTSKLGMTIGSGSTLSMVMAYDDQEQHLPGALTAAEMAENPRQANPVAVALGGNVLSLDEFRFGGTYRKAFRGAHLEATGYYTPRGIAYLYTETRRTNQDFVNRGATARAVLPSLFGSPISVTTGIDYQDTPITTGAFGRANTPVAGQTLSDLQESATTVGPYALADVNLGGRVTASAGIRYDHIRFSTENLIRPQEGVSEIVHEQLSPRIGLTFRVADNLAVYGSYNEGFEAPILDQLRASPSRDGEFVGNQTLQPIDVRAFEVGARGQIGRRMTFEAAAYRQRTRNLIVSQSFLRLPPLVGQFVAFVNAGKVDQNGLEFGATLRPFGGMHLSGSYTFSDFTYRQFVSGGRDVSGNTVPGVPAHNIFGEVSYRTARGLTVAFDIQRVGGFFVNDLNSASNAPYVIGNLRVGHDLRVGRGLQLSPWIGLQNLRDKVYVAQTQVNAAADRYFNPLPGMTFLAGVKFGY